MTWKTDSPTTPPPINGASNLRMLGERRDRTRLLLQTERDRILRIETSLTEQIQQLDEQLDHDRRDLARRDEELEWRTAELAEQAEQVARRREELEEYRRRWEVGQAEAGDAPGGIAERSAAADRETRRAAR